MASKAEHRATLVSAIESLCVSGLAPVVAGMGQAFGDFLDGGFIAEVKGCLERTGTCTPAAAAYTAHTAASVVPLDAKGPPALIFSGGQDDQVTAEQIACTVEFATTSGLTPQLCHGAGDDHFTVVTNRRDEAIAWGEAALAGDKLPACETVPVGDCTW